MKITDSLFLCLNYEGGAVPKRIRILPPGPVIKGRDGRTWSLPDAGALCERMNAAISTQKKPECCIDENHSTDIAAPEGRPSPAVGWFKNFTEEPDGAVWADVEWNAAGEDDIANRRYRYISPAFYSNDKKEITEIVRAALTNSPNLDNPALNSQSPEEPVQEDIMDKKELCAALGLPETATDEEVLAACKTKQPQLNTARQQVDLAAYAPRADLNAMEARAVAAEKKVTELNAANLKTKAEKAVDDAIAARKIAPVSRDTYLELCSTDAGLASFSKIVAATPAILPEGTVVTNAEVPAADTKTELNASERAIENCMGYSADEYKKIKEAGK